MRRVLRVCVCAVVEGHKSKPVRPLLVFYLRLREKW